MPSTDRIAVRIQVESFRNAAWHGFGAMYGNEECPAAAKAEAEMAAFRDQEESHDMQGGWCCWFSLDGLKTPELPPISPPQEPLLLSIFTPIAGPSDSMVRYFSSRPRPN